MLYKVLFTNFKPFLYTLLKTIFKVASIVPCIGYYIMQCNLLKALFRNVFMNSNLLYFFHEDTFFPPKI
jgi:hypothetical protein